MSNLLETAVRDRETAAARLNNEKNLSADEQRSLLDTIAHADGVVQTFAEIGQTAAATTAGAFDPRGGGQRGTAVYGRPLSTGLTLRDLPDAASSDDVTVALGRHVANLVERRAQNEGTNSAGGFLVPTPVAANVLSLAVGRARTVEAGARIVPMDSLTLSMPKVTGLPSLSWRAESAPIPESSATFGRALFTARSAATICRVSIEALEDVGSFGQVVTDALAQAASIEIDRVGLYGAGTTTEPQGLKGTLSGAQVTSLGTNGGPASYATIAAAKALVKGRAWNPTAAILSTRTEAAISTVPGNDGHFVAPPAYLDDLPILGAAGLPTNLTQGSSNAAADVFVGDWSQLAYGLRTAFSVRVLDQLFAATGEIGLLAWMRLDVQTLRADAFQNVTGATN